MIITVKSERLTKDWLIDRVSELQVYEWYCHGIKLGKSVVKCPYRNDKSVGSFGIYKGNGAILWKDLATDESGNCITLVQKMYNITYQEAIEKIASDLSLNSNSKQVPRIVIPDNPDCVEGQKAKCLIQVSTRRWNAKDDQYWGQFKINRLELELENVHPIKELFINRVKQLLLIDELLYVYNYPEGLKVYRPMQPKGQKWKSSLPLKRVVHLENMNKEYNTMVTVNLKDYITIRKIYPYVIQIQNESMGALPKEIAQQITDNSKKVYYGGNSDKIGKEMSYKITEFYKWKHINPPDRLLPHSKDFSDWCRDEGIVPLIEHLTKKGVII